MFSLARLASLHLSVVVACLSLQAGQATPASEASHGQEWTATAEWPIATEGRLRPLLSFARDAQIIICGKAGQGGYAPLAFLWACHLDWKRVESQPLIALQGDLLREAVGPPGDGSDYSYRELVANPSFQALVEEGRRRQSTGHPLTGEQREALALYRRLVRMKDLAEGSPLRLIPPIATGAAAATSPSAWISPRELRLGRPLDVPLRQAFASLAIAYHQEKAEALEQALTAIRREVLRRTGGQAPWQPAFEKELGLLQLRPASWAAGAYLMAFLMGSFAFRWSWLSRFAGVLACIAFVAHSLDLAWRWSILGRLPLLSFEESMVLGTWVVVLLAAGVGWRRRLLPLMAGTWAIAAVVLSYRGGLPVDMSLSSAAAQLQGHAWLSVHVLAMILAFAAFALALIQANFSLWWQWRRPQGDLRGLLFATDRVMWLGLLFLVVGIGTGAFWADQSWGRFWAWSPKETWSLITMMSYFLLLHARQQGWLGAFGQAVGAILAFLAMLMTTIGVNAFMGIGRHDFSPSAGLPWWALTIGLFELLLLPIAGYLTGHFRATSTARLLGG